MIRLGLRPVLQLTYMVDPIVTASKKNKLPNTIDSHDASRLQITKLSCANQWMIFVINGKTLSDEHCLWSLVLKMNIHTRIYSLKC